MVDDEEDAWALLASEPSGFLETPSPRHLIELADNDAAATLTAWLTGIGLAVQIESICPAEAGSVVGTPGLAVLKDEMEQAAQHANERASLVADLAGSGSGDSISWIEGARTAIELYGEVRAALQDAELALKRLAQLALSVSALTAGGERSKRLERAAIAVLHPPMMT